MIDYFLADDLSGALDAAAAFHAAGRRVRIVLSSSDWRPGADDEVVGVTTETRNVPPADAAAIVTHAIEQARSRGARLVYKKIDSTLRGPVRAELEALARALPEARLLFAPANPAAGRTVRDGVLLVRGVPVAETEFGRDPVCPVQSSLVRTHAGGIPAERMVIPDTSVPAELEQAVSAMAQRGEQKWRFREGRPPRAGRSVIRGWQRASAEPRAGGGTFSERRCAITDVASAGKRSGR